MNDIQKIIEDLKEEKKTWIGNQCYSASQLVEVLIENGLSHFEILTLMFSDDSFERSEAMISVESILKSLDEE